MQNEREQKRENDGRFLHGECHLSAKIPYPPNLPHPLDTRTHNTLTYPPTNKNTRGHSTGYGLFVSGCSTQPLYFHAKTREEKVFKTKPFFFLLSYKGAPPNRHAYSYGNYQAHAHLNLDSVLLQQQVALQKKNEHKGHCTVICLHPAPSPTYYGT